MAFSLSQIFGGAPANPAPAATSQPSTPAATTPGNIPDNIQQPSPSNPTVPANSPAASENQDPPAPLDAFKDLWAPKVDKDGKPVVEDNSVFPNFDPAKIKEVVSKADFIGQIPQEVMAKIEAGGKEATQAMMQIVNAASRKAYMENTMATSKLIEAALKKQSEDFASKLPTILKQHGVRDNLRENNPLFSNPAVQPIISALEQQLAQKHPNATTAELTKMAQQYISELGTVFSPAAKATDTNSKNPETDWDQWFNS